MTEEALFQKYNIPGPRYTSYPTVPYWSDSPSAAQWIELLRQNLRAETARDRAAALYVHIPFCETLCTYCGCNTLITKNRQVVTPYLKALLHEWQLYRQALDEFFPLRLSELHLGGGTPTYLSPQELKFFLEEIFLHVDRAADWEGSVEVDPRVTSGEHLAELAALGFRRVSMGIQDFDPTVQELVHRVQSVKCTSDLVENARSLGYTSINFDLIYGLPRQTRTSMRQTFDAVLTLRPDRIAFYGYAHVPWIKPSQRRFSEKDLPPPEEKRALYELGRTMLRQGGYQEIGMDHFALPHDSLSIAFAQGSLHRNFMGYTATRTSPLLGLGVSAISDSWSAFCQNEKSVHLYQERLAQNQLPLLRGHILTEEDLSLRRQILNLMTGFETNWDDCAEFVGEETKARMVDLEKDGLIRIDAKNLHVTERGKPFLRNICMAFDLRLQRKLPQHDLFSKTV